MKIFGKLVQLIPKKVKKSRDLQLVVMRKSDGQLYTCEFEDNEGEAVSASSPLKVEDNNVELVYDTSYFGVGQGGLTFSNEFVTKINNIENTLENIPSEGEILNDVVRYVNDNMLQIFKSIMSLQLAGAGSQTPVSELSFIPKGDGIYELQVTGAALQYIQQVQEGFHIKFVMNAGDDNTLANYIAITTPETRIVNNDQTVDIIFENDGLDVKKMYINNLIAGEILRLNLNEMTLSRYNA